MNDQPNTALTVAAIKFKWQKDDRTYDYFVPSGLELAPGDKVIVETKRGETTVEVVEIKTQSDKAEKHILRRAEQVEPVATDATQPAEDWDF